MSRIIIYQAPAELPAKTQAVRLLDVFAIGPTMIYFGLVADRVNPFLRAFMVLSGIGTVVYNGANYWATKQRVQQLQAARNNLLN